MAKNLFTQLCVLLVKMSNKTELVRGTSRRRKQGGRTSTKIKDHQLQKYAKNPIVSSVSVSFSIFRLQQLLRTTLTTRGPPLDFIFANQFKCITREKLRVFVLNIAISDPYLRVVNGPTSASPNPARKYKREPGPNPTRPEKPGSTYDSASPNLFMNLRQ